MPKSKITAEQCNESFDKLKELLGDEDTWKLNSEGGQYTIANVKEDGSFKLIYKPLGPASFIHCCAFLTAILSAQGNVVADDDDEDDEDSEEDDIMSEEEDEDEKPAPKARASQK